MAYIGVQPAEAYTSFAVQHFTTSATTSYTLDNAVANENEIALFINNVRQQPGSSYAYTASGTTLTLSAATSASDTMYCVFIGKAVQTVTPATGSVTNDMIAYPLAKSGATVATFNRTSSDGDIITVQKDGTTVGTIYNGGSNLGVNSQGGLLLVDDIITPTSGADNTKDIGRSSARWKDAYIGGNIYLGGTGSANALDDYEEGTWTPTIVSGTCTFGNVSYTKIGRLVNAKLAVSTFSDTSSSNTLQFDLPFVVSATPGTTTGTVMSRSVTTLGDGLVAYVQQNASFIRIYQNNSSGAWGLVQHSDLAGTSPQFFINITYETSA